MSAATYVGQIGRMGRRAVLAFSASIAVILSSHSAVDAGSMRLPASYDRAQVVELYESLAFGSEVKSSGSEIFQNQLVKRSPGRQVQVMVLPQPSAPINETLSSAAAVVQDLAARSSGMNIHIVTPDEMTRLVLSDNFPDLDRLSDSLFVYVGDRQEMLASIKKEWVANGFEGPFKWTTGDYDGPVCLTMGQVPNDAKRLGFAKAWIQTGAAQQECLYEEIMQSFGIAKDFGPGVPSMFSDDGVHTSPSELDWLLWRIHTDKRLVAGMNRQQARVAARLVLDDITEPR